MGDHDASATRGGPVRIVGMRIAPPYPPGAAPRPGAMLTIEAQLDLGPHRAESQWWMEQLRSRIEVGPFSSAGGPGSWTGLVTVHVNAPADGLEAAARRLAAAVDEANAAYPDQYATWRRERDAQVADERRRQQQRRAEQQAVLDRVMDEYRSD